MSKTLSQWEIDALLNSIGSDDSTTGGGAGGAVGVLPNVPERSIKLYDFRRPDRFSKEHIRAIQNIHETFARVTASSPSWQRLGSIIRCSCARRRATVGCS